jgi:hypothetical protein
MSPTSRHNICGLLYSCLRSPISSHHPPFNTSSWSCLVIRYVSWAMRTPWLRVRLERFTGRQHPSMGDSACHSFGTLMIHQITHTHTHTHARTQHTHTHMCTRTHTRTHACSGLPLPTQSRTFPERSCSTLLATSWSLLTWNPFLDSQAPPFQVPSSRFQATATRTSTMSGSTLGVVTQLMRSMRLVRHQSTQASNGCRYGPHGQTEKVLVRLRGQLAFQTLPPPPILANRLHIGIVLFLEFPTPRQSQYRCPSDARTLLSVLHRTKSSLINDDLGCDHSLTRPSPGLPLCSVNQCGIIKRRDSIFTGRRPR